MSDRSYCQSYERTNQLGRTGGAARGGGAMIRGILVVAAGAALGALAGYFGSCRSGACPLTSTWWGGSLYGALIGYMIGQTI